MAINKIHSRNNIQDEMMPETNELWASISDEQQAAISGGYQLQERFFSGPVEAYKKTEPVVKTGPTEMQKRCILGVC